MSTFNPIFYYNTITATSDPYLTSQVAYYPFNTNANDLINGYNGTSTNIVYTNAGIVSTSATFNGTSSLISIADFNDFSFVTGAFSINIWVYPVGNSAYLVSKRNATFIEYQSTYNISTSTITFNMYSGGTTANFIGRTFSSALTANAWNMVTYTFPGGTTVGNLKAYLNGVLLSGTNQSAGVYVGMTNTTAGVVLGRQGNTAAGYLNGRLDQTRFWKGRELTQSEITNIYSTLY
jgi:hypothetical protein